MDVKGAKVSMSPLRGPLSAVWDEVEGAEASLGMGWGEGKGMNRNRFGE